MNQQPYQIIEEHLDKDLKKRIYAGFSEHALASVGSDGNMEDITFIARGSGHFLGAVHGKTFWGALHIKYLYVTPEARKNGVGRTLMDRIFEKGVQMSCRFAFVETMNFQAVDFYKNLGFIEEYVRSGYDKETSFHYMRKDFHA